MTEKRQIINDPLRQLVERETAGLLPGVADKIKAAIRYAYWLGALDADRVHKGTLMMGHSGTCATCNADLPTVPVWRGDDAVCSDACATRLNEIEAELAAMDEARQPGGIDPATYGR